MKFVERPFADPGDKPFPNPELPRGSNWCEFDSNRLKLPITETLRAFGAHTLNDGPRLAIDGGQVRAKLVVDAVVAAFVEEIEVLIGEEAGVGGGRSFRGFGDGHGTLCLTT